MEAKILEITKKVYHNHLTPEMATKLLLDLFDVSESVCDCNFEHVHTNWYKCTKCGAVTSF
jgi:hypothetical protein